MTMHTFCRTTGFTTALLGMLLLTSDGFSQQDKPKPDAASQEGPASARSDTQDQADRPSSQREQTGKAWLGVVIAPTGDGEGVLIEELYPNGPAAQADLQQGDILLSIDGIRAMNPDQVSDRLAQQDPDSEVAITIQRDGEKREMKVRLGNREEALGRDQETMRLLVPQREMRVFRQQLGRDDALMLEQHRHLATQHQRIEELLHKVMERLDRLEARLADGDQGATPRVSESIKEDQTEEVQE